MALSRSPSYIHHSAKLTTAQVKEIRRRYANGEIQMDLADEYGVTQAAISNIVRAKSWPRVRLNDG